MVWGAQMGYCAIKSERLGVRDAKPIHERRTSVLVGLYDVVGIEIVPKDLVFPGTDGCAKWCKRLALAVGKHVRVGPQPQ